MEPTSELTEEDVMSEAEEALRLFSEDSEVEICKDIINGVFNIKQLCEHKEAHIKEDIRAWMKLVQEEESRIPPPEASYLHRQRVLAVQKEQERKWESLLALEEERKALDRVREELREKEEILQKKRGEIETLVRREMPRIVHQLSLYAHITNIGWDYNVTGRVKGLIANPKIDQLEAFDFDIAQHSNYEITNRLWDLMDSESASPSTSNPDLRQA